MSARVVVTGMGVVGPLGPDLPRTASALMAGEHGIVPREATSEGDDIRVHAPVRGLDVAEHFPRRELHRMDRFAQLAVVAAREAASRAGLEESVDRDRLAVLLGTALGGVHSGFEAQQQLTASGVRRVSPLTIPTMMGNSAAAGVAIDLGAGGEVVTPVAACASGTVAIGQAMRMIRHGEAEVVVAGGSEAMTAPVVYAGFQNLRALTRATDPDRASLPFDRDRSGFVMGEGAAALVLEAEDHARARGAAILGVVAGYACTDDAHHITAPEESGAAVQRAIRVALRDAGDDGALVHVNAHGTGTALNDRVEARALAAELGDRAVVTSTKSMTGHLAGAAGALEAVAGLIALQEQRVPATVGTRQLDEGIDIDVVLGSARAVAFSTVLSLSLGFGGHNAALVLRRPEA